jgi:dCTP deaminase
MGVLPDWQIQRDVKIEPFVAESVRSGVISYGVTSYGYDVRVGRHFKIFTNARCAVVDPKNFDTASFVDIEGDYCLIPPNSFALAETVEYLEIPRNCIGICVGKSTYARCFRGDTRVALVDGSAPTLEEMARRAQDGELFWGYSVGEHGRIIVTLLEAPRYIGRDALVEVVLDNGESIFCTPDHKFVTRDGRMVEANTLRPGSSLMPLYRQLVGDEAMVWQPLDRRSESVHLLEEQWRLRRGRGESSLNLVGAGTAGWPGLSPRSPGTAPEAATSSRTHTQLACGHWPTRKLRVGTGSPGSTPGIGALCRGFADSAPATQKGESATAAPDNHKVAAIRDVPGTHDVYCLTVPEAGNFALDAGVFVSNCGIIVNVTPLEPEWRGRVTIEISNTTPLPAKIYAGEGIAQILFLRGEAVCRTSYADKKGKYQDQKGLTLPFVQGPDQQP